jgi:hypothetical protein
LHNGTRSSLADTILFESASYIISRIDRRHHFLMQYPPERHYPISVQPELHKLGIFVFECVQFAGAGHQLDCYL